MTEMLILYDGSLVPMTSVQRLEPRWEDRDGVWARSVIGLDGDPIGIVGDRNLEKFRGALVPAADGWRIACTSSPQDAEFHLWTEPVVAWRVDGEDCTPITVEPVAEHYLIVAPDGTVTAPHVTMWNSLDEATKARRAEWEAERAKNAAA